MPTYVYECAKCGEELEAWQSFSDAPLKKHPGCGGKLTKVFQPVGIVFKGSGFNRTDSRSGSKRSRSDGSGDSKDSTSETSEKSEKAEKSDASTKAAALADSSSGNGAKKSSDTKQSSSPKESSTPSTTSK